ncbi:hypothetical protein OK349_08615 [Sphingomonas sp. BT-65]|uniref:hypothetical protein n=1 Tax=Sphingomonas sp. BT-65 TaxID=2989821 RepID=UPI002235676C|nr:hypothetical protein [Sphingomonas sp. BT-65]MCW4461770.1 hypothetical protein [Sphingomonas sp. BT-65]
MPFTSPFGWVLLGAALLAGWLFGIAFSPQSRQLKKRFREREVIIAKYKREMEKALVKARERVRQLEQERDGAAGATDEPAVPQPDTVEAEAEAAAPSARKR